MRHHMLGTHSSIVITKTWPGWDRSETEHPGPSPVLAPDIQDKSAGLYQRFRDYRLLDFGLTMIQSDGSSSHFPDGSFSHFM